MVEHHIGGWGAIRGIYHLTVSVVTEAGAKGTKTEDFKVS